MAKYLTEWDRSSLGRKVLLWLRYRPICYLQYIRWFFVGLVWMIVSNYHERLYETRFRAYKLGFVLLGRKTDLKMGMGIPFEKVFHEVLQEEYAEQVIQNQIERNYQGE